MTRHKKYRKYKPKQKTRKLDIPKPSPVNRKEPTFSTEGTRFKVSLSPVSMAFQTPRDLSFSQFKEQCIDSALTTMTGGQAITYNEVEAEKAWRKIHEED